MSAATTVPPSTRALDPELPWEDAVGELAQLVRRLLGVVERLGQEGGEVRLLVVQGLVCQLQRDDRVHQPLLRAVANIPNQPTALVRVATVRTAHMPRRDRLSRSRRPRDGRGPSRSWDRRSCLRTHAASLALTTNHPGPTGASPEPTSSSCASSIIIAPLSSTPPDAGGVTPAVGRRGRPHRSRTTDRSQATGCRARLPRERAADRTRG
jgi:hypothetical protein